MPTADSFERKLTVKPTAASKPKPKKNELLENVLNAVPGARFLANTGLVLSGQMPSKEDFQNGALGLVGGVGAVRGAVGAAKMAPYAIESVIKNFAPKTYINNAAKTAYTIDPVAGWGSKAVFNAREDAALRVAQNKARVVKAIKPDSLVGMLNRGDTTFKNMFETGATTGALRPTNRVAAEDLVFGAGNTKKLNYGYVAAEKPIPGTSFMPGYKGNNFLALNNPDTKAFYGDAAVVFKKGANKDATVTYGDSGARGALESIFGKTSSGMSPVPFTQMGSRIDEAGRAIPVNEQPMGGIPYIEAQWTKPLGIKDVSKIIAPSYKKTDIEAALKAAGIRKKVVTWEDLNKPGVLDKVKTALAKAKAVSDAKSRVRRTPIDDFGKLISPEG